jgi:hypothetical protein
MNGSRGAVVVETALTVGIGLTILLFSIQVGVLGFLQITADAASYVAARGAAVGTLPSTNPASAAHAAFKQIATTDIVSPASPSPAPSAPLGVNYEYNVGYNANGSRHSGASVLQPLQVPTTVTTHGKENILGKLLGVGAQDVEAQWTECTPHFNTANTPYAQCGATGNPVGYNVNYFTSGENTPMYYVGFNFMLQCTQTLPWTSCTTTPQFLSLGVGSYLDTDNWAATTPGVNGSAYYYSAGPGGRGVAPSQTFEYMGCHYDRLNNLSFFFLHYPDLPSLYSGIPTEGVGGWGTTIDAWLATKPTNFKNILSFFSTTVDPGADPAIQQIYAWDTVVPKGTSINATEPGTNSAYVPDPGQGC